MSQKRKATHFVFGLTIGTATAAIATFLYKTKKGKQFRKNFKPHIDNAKGFLVEHIKDIKTQAKKLEAILEDQTQTTQRKTKKVKRQVKKTTTTVKRKVFLKSGKPLVK